MKVKNKTLVLLSIFVILFIFSVGGSGDTLEVDRDKCENQTGYYCTIQGAVDAAGDGDKILINAKGKEALYAVPFYEDVDVENSLELLGEPYMGSRPTVNGEEDLSGVEVNSGEAIFNNLTFQNGIKFNEPGSAGAVVNNKFLSSELTNSYGVFWNDIWDWYPPPIIIKEIRDQIGDDVGTFSATEATTSTNGDYLTILSNDIKGKDYGIYLESPPSSLIGGNVIEDNGTGIGFNYAVLYGTGSSSGASTTAENSEVFNYVNFNSIVDNESGLFLQYAPLTDATLNWWGDSDGPTLGWEDGEEKGDLIDASEDEVIYSPWLGSNPDGSPEAGVQIGSPLTFVVDDVGQVPRKADLSHFQDFLPTNVNDYTVGSGYLNRAIFASNLMPYQDIINVRAGSYDASEKITAPVLLKGSEPGAIVDAEAGSPAIHVAADNTTIRNLEITSTGQSGEVEGIMVGDSDGFSDLAGQVLIENNLIDGVNTTSDLTVEGIHAKFYDDGGDQIDGLIIQNNKITNITEPNAGADGVKLQADLNSVDVVGNTIENVEGSWSYGVVTTPSDLESGIPKNVTISRNVFNNITANTYDSVAVGIDTEDGDPGTYTSGDEVTVRYNDLSGADYGVLNKDTDDEDDVDAILNWWGSPTGPTHESNPAGDGVLVSDNVIYSPWLGIGPDDDPDTVGVQLKSPLTFVVDDIGPAPDAGYLDTAIFAANETGTDTDQDSILVNHGTYIATQDITNPVEILSEEGSAISTFLTGNVSIESSNVTLGQEGLGFTVEGDVVVDADAGEGNIKVNGNILLGKLTHTGDGTVYATFNNWGTDNDGDGIAPDVNNTGTGNVFFSPWLLNVPGTENMTYKVADIGADPEGGLNRAIDDANKDPYKDTVIVDHGTYLTSSDQPVEQDLEIISVKGSPANTFINGDSLNINSSDVRLGKREEGTYVSRGFTVNADITVKSGVDSSNVHLNWNNLYGLVTNDGNETLDATWNWWGDTNPSDDTVGDVDYDPWLPAKVGAVLDYMKEHEITDPESAVVGVVAENSSPSEQATAQVVGMGLDPDQADSLIDEYGRSQVTNAMENSDTSGEFVQLLNGFSLPAGAAGGLTNNTVAGGAGSVSGKTVGAVFEVCELIKINFPLSDFEGNPAKDLHPTVSLVKLDEDGNLDDLKKVTTAKYNEDSSAYVTTFSSCELTPGYYQVQIDLPDGSSLSQVIQVKGKEE